jgi:hypothetical protein
MIVAMSWQGCCRKRFVHQHASQGKLTSQRLSGASLLVFKNKSDVPGAMTEDEVREVRSRACGRWYPLSGQW